MTNKHRLALEFALLALASATTSCAAPGPSRGGGVYLVGVAGGG